MRTCWVTPLFVFVLAATTTLNAQPYIHGVDSIECTVANADLIFIGRIVDFDGKEPVDDRLGRKATIAIEDTLKLDVRNEPYPRLELHLPFKGAVLADWKKRSCRLLIAHDNLVPKANRVLDLTPETLEVLTANFKLLRDPDQVIEAAKRALRRTPAGVKRVHTFSLTVSPELAMGTKWAHHHKHGNLVLLRVPVNKNLEKKALKFIDSDDYSQRYVGVKALWYFNSEKNIAHLKMLLDDPGYTRTFLPVGGDDKGKETRDYGVRFEAYRTLRSWGVVLEKPLLREEILK
jgi:hypothetical protein